jgi:hypothetical protein
VNQALNFSSNILDVCAICSYSGGTRRGVGWRGDHRLESPLVHIIFPDVDCFLELKFLKYPEAAGTKEHSEPLVTL